MDHLPAQNHSGDPPCPPADFFFCQKVMDAVPKLTRRLETHYQQLHPEQGERIRQIVADAEATAWKLSFFPHLLLPDLVEVRVAELALRPALAGAA